MGSSTIGSLIRRERRRKKMSCKELADYLNCSVSQVINVEKSVANFSKGKRNSLAELFEIDAGLLEGDNINVVPSKQAVSFGKTIKNHRKLLRLTQTELAEELGYSNSGAISLIEQGKKGMSKKKIVKMAELCDVHVAELLQQATDSILEKETEYVNKFIFLAKSKRKPPIWDSLLSLIDTAVKEITTE